jgi:AcrR family transcriptional regulator
MRAQSSPAIHPSIDTDTAPDSFSLPSPALKQRADGGDRQALIDAATELFSRLGFKATTLEDIAAAAGCSRSAIRREFGGKAGLLESIVYASSGPNASPCFRGASQHNTLRQDICQLVEWEAGRMRGHKDFLDCTLSQDSADPAVTRIAAQVSFASAEVIGERLRRHPNLNDEERQFLLYAIQAVGFALGFVQPDLADPARTRSRIKKLASTLADSIERHDALPGSPQPLLQSLLPV